jgi:uncharacterized protein YbaR (Trm112 family)
MMTKGETKSPDSMEELLEMICCPHCKGDLSYESLSKFICHHCDQSYLIQDEIPVLLSKAAG